MASPARSIITNIVGKVLGYLIAAVLLYFGFMFLKEIVFAPKPWMGIYYADAEASSSNISENFETFEDCRDWATDLASGEPDGSWRYTCGYKCKFVSDVLPGDSYECEVVKP